MENTVIIPTFGIKEDDEAVKQLASIFAVQKVETMGCNDITNDSGILYGITWSIKKANNFTT